MTYGNKCFIAYDPGQISNWVSGLAFCNALGGTLPSVHSAAENTAIGSVVTNGWPFWLGYSRPECGSAGWSWTDGSNPIDYTNWQAGQPDCGSNERCVTYRPSGQWQDSSCLYSSDFQKLVCQFSMVAAPAPSYNMVNCLQANGGAGVPYGSKCLVPYVTTNYIWTDAYRFCRNLGGTLASIHSLDEHNLARTRIYSGYEIWIGASRVDCALSFSWLDGSSMDYSRYTSGQPDCSGDQKCAMISTNSFWYDDYCYNSKPWTLCQFAMDRKFFSLILIRIVKVVKL